MSTLLTQTSQTTEVKSNAKIGDFLYEFTYNYDPTKKITKLSCSIFNESRSVSYGVINLENSRRTVSLDDDETANYTIYRSGSTTALLTGTITRSQIS